MCPGYRNQLDLMFRDQSKQVAHKVQGQKRKVARVSPERDKDISYELSQALSHRPRTGIRDWLANVTVVPLPLQVPAEDQASCFFFSNYVEPANAHNSMYEYLPAMYGSTHRDSALFFVITALGLAGLSNHKCAPQLMSEATLRYDAALHLVNEMLGDPVTAKADQTLVSILLLGLYEVRRPSTLCNLPS